MPNVNVLLLWSGGCDSTHILETYLNTGFTVRTIGLSHQNVHSSDKMRAARTKIRKWFRRRKKKEWPHTEVTVKHEGSFDASTHPDGMGLSQPLIWLPPAMLYLEKEEEDLAVGYIKGDDVWHRWPQVLQMFEAMKKMRDQSGSLVTPAEWTSKAQVIHGLHKELLRLCWWCESPDSDGDECGKCASCLTHALAELAIARNLDYFLRHELRKQHCYPLDMDETATNAIGEDEKELK